MRFTKYLGLGVATLLAACGSPPATRKAAGSYFNLRRGMADTRIERKALQFVPIPLDTPA